MPALRDAFQAVLFPSQPPAPLALHPDTCVSCQVSFTGCSYQPMGFASVGVGLALVVDDSWRHAWLQKPQVNE